MNRITPSGRLDHGMVKSATPADRQALGVLAEETGTAWIQCKACLLVLQSRCPLLSAPSYRNHRESVLDVRPVAAYS